MQEANILGELTLVQYPSNHCFVDGPKILLIGTDDQWKNKLIDTANEFWTEGHVTFYYIPENDRDINDTDQISWIHQHILHCHYIVGYISPNDHDSLLVLPYGVQDETFMLYDDNLDNNIKNFFKNLNPNLVSDTKDVIVGLRNMWKKVNS